MKPHRCKSHIQKLCHFCDSKPRQCWYYCMTSSVSHEVVTAGGTAWYHSALCGRCVGSNRNERKTNRECCWFSLRRLSQRSVSLQTACHALVWKSRVSHPADTSTGFTAESIDHTLKNVTSSHTLRAQESTERDTALHVLRSVPVCLFQLFGYKMSICL